jgi:hypothetical protein
MKTMKLALLATAAVAAVTVSARADEVSDLKAQLEALNARVAQLEAAPALPAGYSLVTTSEIAPLSLTGEKTAEAQMYKSSNRIAVLPTADAPAATTIDWDLEVRAAITYYDEDKGTSDDDGVAVHARGRIRVKASTDTSVGTVGVDLRVQGGFDSSSYLTTYFGSTAYNNAIMNIAWGWWQMTPEWTLGGGYTGSLNDPGHGMDGWATYGNTVWFGVSDQEQLRLTYSSGPLTWAVALEDNDAADIGIALASRMDYSGDTISASLAGFYMPIDSAKDYWQIAAGADFSLGDMATLSVSAAFAETYWGASAYAKMDLTDATYFEVSAGYANPDNGVFNVNPNGSDDSYMLLNAGIYWAPVDQLSIGLQADHYFQKGSSDPTSVSFVTWFRF